jgi:CheY-like chemotaxis protein
MKRHRIKYHESVNGLDAFEVYKDSPQSFDFILMDMSMPVMDVSFAIPIQFHEISKK